jgi:hypothetical protein
MTIDLRSGGGREASGRHISITVITASTGKEGQKVFLECDNRLLKMSEFWNVKSYVLVCEYRRLEKNCCILFSPEFKAADSSETLVPIYQIIRW